MINKCSRLSTAALGIVVAGIALGAVAQSYPARPITLIINQETGGPTELFGRALGKEFQSRGNPPFIVETRPGGSGMVGVTACVRARNDGYTACIVPRDMISITPFQEKMEFDPAKDLEPVIQLGWLANVIVAHPSLKVDSLKGLIDYTKQNPGKVNYTAFATAQSIMQWIMNETGVSMTFIPFKGGPSAMQAFFGGDIHVMYLAAGNAGLSANIKAGKIRALAMPDRHELLPGVPTFVEAGLPQFGFRSWLGIFMPAGAPRDAITKLNNELRPIIKSAEFNSSTMVPFGYVPIGNTPEEFAKFIAMDRKDGAALAKLAGARVQ
ncbi:MAG: Bug family tripartite tricarboxylate transporter substrate binding protein [Burkholderiales bacterium]